MVAKHYDSGKALRQGLWNTLFSWRKFHSKCSQIVNYYGDSELLRRSIFSMAGVPWECRFSAELEKLEKYSRWGAASKNKSENLGPSFSVVIISCGNRCASVKGNFLFADAPHIGNEIEQKIQTLRWRLAKVAFDTVSLSEWLSWTHGESSDVQNLQAATKSQGWVGDKWGQTDLTGV